MDSEIKRRLRWVQLYLETGDAGFTCRGCGISRPTLRKWVRRYEQQGVAGLVSQSRRPHHSPTRKVFDQQQQWMLALRKERKRGVRRSQHELERLYDCHLSIATLADVLQRRQLSRLKPPTRRTYLRPAKAVPGERVQMDTLKVAPDCYQYTR